MLDKLFDTFRHRWNNYKSNDRKFKRSEPCMHEQVMVMFQAQVIHKMDPSDPLKSENFWWDTLMTTEPYGLDIDDSVWFFSFDDMVSESKNPPGKKSPVRGQG